MSFGSVPTKAGETKIPKLPIGDDKEWEEICAKVLKSHTFFEILQTDEGFLSLQSFLVSFQTLYIDQITFQNILSQILDEYDDFDSVEYFDILETTGDGVITVKEFYVFALLQAAIENEQALMCLFHHGQLIFKVVAGDQESINGDRVESIFRIIGYDEIEIQDKLLEFCIKATSYVTYDMFEMIMFNVFREINSTMVDFDVSEEEMKLVKEEAEHKLSSQYATNRANLTSKLGSQTQVHDNEVELVDPFNDMDDIHDDYESRKEVTNMPLNNGDFDSNPYANQGYSTKHQSNPKQISSNNIPKESMTKYCDPYWNDQNEELNSASSRSNKLSNARKISKESQRNTENEQITVKKNLKVDDKTIHCWSDKKWSIF